MQEILNYFKVLGYNEKETKIFVTLWKLGSKPASTIASVCNYERVYTYKVLQSFLADGIIAETLSKGVKHFWIPSLDLLRNFILKHEQNYRRLNEQFDYIQTSFGTLKSSIENTTPKIQLFEQSNGIKTAYEDILRELQSQ